MGKSQQSQTEATRDANPTELARRLIAARKRAGLSQVQLARTAGVSPTTITQIEKKGVARFDAIARVCKILSESIEDCLRLAGLEVSPEKIARILERRRITPVFPRINPDEYFARTIERMKVHGNVALRCVSVMSPLPVATPTVSTPARWELAKKMVHEGLHVAMCVPFPFKGENFTESLPALHAYYANSYKWAYDSVQKFRQDVPKCAKRVHVFSLKVPDSRNATLVAPPVRLAETRPIFSQYGYKGEVLMEFGVLLHFLDNREDYWVDIWSSDQSDDHRGREIFQTWHDYFREIIEAWQPRGTGPKGEATYDLRNAKFWQQATV